MNSSTQVAAEYSEKVAKKLADNAIAVNICAFYESCNKAEHASSNDKEGTGINSDC